MSKSAPLVHASYVCLARTFRCFQSAPLFTLFTQVCKSGLVAAEWREGIIVSLCQLPVYLCTTVPSQGKDINKYETGSSVERPRPPS